MAPTPRQRCLGLLALLLRICTAAGPNSVSGPSGPATGLGLDFRAPDPTRAKAPLPAPDDMSVIFDLALTLTKSSALNPVSNPIEYFHRISIS
ncbi:unnamed protein product [Bemisia tabaci]|uniref:Uncharacterized protein n=1 Tax=Bemisia tabaci TaxID=7038 RepID=A0A9P0APA3_BEMTA|nr:unnamed protein product [Bemisia tabaci]